MQKIGRIALEGAMNARDLGGFPGADGRSIRPKRLIRSGELTGLTERDKEVLQQEYQLKQVIDFRTDVERAERPEIEISGVHEVFNPILSGEALGITFETGSPEALIEGLMKLSRDQGIDAYMIDIYCQLALSPSARTGYKRFFDLLLETREGATLWHCSAGKDRVGVGTALLLSALGVERELIIEDYMATGEFTRADMAMALRRLGDAPEEIRQVVTQAYGVSPKYIEALFLAADTRYGSMKNYLEEAMGMDKSRIQALRSLYLA